MKALKAAFLLSSASIAFASTAAALDFGGLKESATGALSGGSSSSDLMSMGSKLLSSFQGNPDAISGAKGLLSSFKASDYLGSFDYFDKIKDASLTPSQLKTWNDVKNPISAMILEKNFSFEDSGLSDLVAKTSSALSGNDVEGASSYLTQLKDAATLTKGQSELLSEIQQNLPLIK